MNRHREVTTAAAAVGLVGLLASCGAPTPTTDDEFQSAVDQMTSAVGTPKDLIALNWSALPQSARVAECAAPSTMRLLVGRPMASGVVITQTDVDAFLTGAC